LDIELENLMGIDQRGVAGDFTRGCVKVNRPHCDGGSWPHRVALCAA
jgi:hypothetical protein